MTAPLVMDGHLGGFIQGGDPDTYDPAVWAWLVRVFGPKSVIDVGCGEGHALQWFIEEAGVLDVLGIDGCEKVLEHSPVPLYIDIHDYTAGPFDPARKFDMAWSCEFVEHVEEQFVENFMKTFESARIVAMTYSAPEWAHGGHHHVNCRPQGYWNDVFERHGFFWEESMSMRVREFATARWVKSTFSLFTRL